MPPAADDSSKENAEQEIFLKRIMTIQEDRYTRKGYGAVIAMLIWVTYFWNISSFVQYAWP